MDYDIIPGRSSENAKKALELAESRGFDAAEVRTFRGGYYVPVEIKDEKPAPKTARKRNAKKE